jgi:DNA-binding response OmpR family regulator
MSDVDQSLNLSGAGSVFSTISASGSILVIDDEAGIRESLEVLLSLEGYSVKTADDGEQGLRTLEMENFDLVLLDLALPGQSGLDLLPQIKERQPETPVIMITAYGTVENVVEAIRAGADNFVQKPWDNEKLLADIRSAVARYKAEEENLQLKRTLKQRYNFANIVGKSEIMRRVFDLVAQVAPSRSTVLVQGESGTGKELIAKAIHANSPRRDNAFVPINTGAMPTELLESTLFGHPLSLRRRVFSRLRMAERFSWMKSQPWGWIRRRRFSAFCRIGVSCILGESRRSRLTSALSRRPTSTFAKQCEMGDSGKICSTG